MARIAPRLLLIPLLISLGLAAWADDGVQPGSIENLLNTEIEGASRFAQPLAEAPAAVSVVSAEDIRQYGFRTLAEALQSVRDVYITNERDYSYLGIRGFARPGDYNTRMLLMTDGVRRNDPLYDSAMIGNEAPIEIDWVKRLEFVPGPASALYGANALFGVANAVLWSGADLNGTRLRADLGSGGMARVNLLSGQRLEGGGDWLLGLAVYSRGGENLYFSQYDSPANNHGIAQGLDSERYVKGIAKLNLGDWQFDAGYGFRHKDVPTAYYGTAFNTPGNLVDDTYAYADLAYSSSPAADWSASLRLHAGSYESAGQYAYPGYFNRDTAQATWAGADYLLTYTGARDHKLLIGGEAQYAWHLDQRNFDVSPLVTYLDDRRSATSAGIFVQDEWRLGPTWMANFGVRADRVRDFGMLSPRAALIHQMSPAATLKLIYGQAFRPPNTYERYYSDGNVTQKLNPNLKPERIATAEAVVDYVVTPVLRLSASCYRYHIDDLIELVTDPGDGLLHFVNQAPIYAHGLELEAEAVLEGGLHLKGSVSRQEVDQSGGNASNSPRLLGELLVDGPLFATGWTIGLNLQAIDRRTTLSGEVPGYGVGNLVLTQKGTPARGRWSVGIYNLSGHRYLDPGSDALKGNVIALDGRQFRLGWELGF